MMIDATFWVAVSFFVFIGVLFYFKFPQKINSSLNEKINEIKKTLSEAEKLKKESKSLLSDYEKKIDKSKKESKEIINLAKKESEKIIIEKNKKFHQIIDDRKRNIEEKIIQMKKNAINEIKNASVSISIEVVENLIANSIDKKKLESIFAKSLEETKISLKQTKV